MKKSVNIILSLSLVVCILFSIAIGVSAASNGTIQNLEVTLTSDKEEYALTDEIELKVEIKNTVDTEGPGGTVTFTASDDLVKKDSQPQSFAKVEPNQTLTFTQKIVSSKNDSPKTGDSLTIFLWIGLLIAAAVVIVLCIKHKKSAKALSLVLCAALVLAMVPVGTLAAEANNITVDKVIKVDGKEYTVGAKVVLNTDSSSSSAGSGSSGNVDPTDPENNDPPFADQVPDTTLPETPGEDNVPPTPEQGETNGEPAAKNSREGWVTSLVEANEDVVYGDIIYSFDDNGDAYNPMVVETAIRHSYVQLTPDEDNIVKFYPREIATREFLAVTAVNALKYDYSSVEVPAWSDVGDIDNPQAVAQAVRLGIIAADGAFNPDGLITEADVDKALARVNEIKNATVIDENAENEVEYAAGVPEITLAYTADVDAKTITTNEFNKLFGLVPGKIFIIHNSSVENQSLAIKVSSFEIVDGKMVINYVQPELHEVVKSLDLEGSVVSGGTMTPAKNVKFGARGGNSGSIPLIGKKTISVNIDGKGSVSGYIDLQKLDYKFDVDASWSGINIYDAYLAVISETDFTVEAELGSTDIVESVKIADFNVPVGYGVNASGEIYFEVTATGSVKIGYSIYAKAGAQYSDADGLRAVNDITPVQKNVSLSGNAQAGFDFQPAAEFLGIDLISVGAELGLGLDGDMYNMQSSPVQFCIDVGVYLFLTIYAQIGPESFNLRKEFEIFNSDNSIFTRFIHVEETGIVEECTRGFGNYSGKVVDATTNAPLQGAKIQLFRAGILADTAYTNASGEFVGSSLPAGNYNVVVSCTGYVPYETNKDIIGGNTTIIETQLMISRQDESETVYSCSGQIINSYNGNAIPGATIEVYSEELATVGQHITTTSSSSDGTYSFSAPVGKYKIKVTCENFVTNYGYATLTNNITNLNIMLNPTDISGFNGQLRTVLTWGQNPRDLDSHLVGPEGDGRFHVFFSAKVADHSDLDVDDTTSYGPETVTVYETEPGVYSYYVHDYTNRSSSYSNGISTSGTKVQLYMGNVLKYTIDAPANRDGTLWHVYDYDSRTGVVTLVNEFSYESSASAVGGTASVRNYSMTNPADIKKF